MVTDCKLKTTFLLTMAAVSVFAAPTVTDVVAKQRFPWNGLVDITCKVSGISGAAQCKFAVDAVIPDSGVVRKVSQFWVVKNGVNSTDKIVQANGNYKLLWDAQADLGAVIYSNMVMRVSVDYDKVQLWKGGPYWATANIGAKKPEDYGYYFWWGDTVGYRRSSGRWLATDGSPSDFSFEPDNTPTYNKSIATLKSRGWITAAEVLVPEHDAAHKHWGGSWRMPTKQEISDLVSKCDWSYTTVNNVRGCRVSGKGDYSSNSIFLPCAGYGNWDSHDLAGQYGYYWASVPYSDSNNASYLYIKDYYTSDHGASNYNRYLGQSVRPVQGFTE